MVPRTHAAGLGCGREQLGVAQCLLAHQRHGPVLVLELLLDATNSKIKRIAGFQVYGIEQADKVWQVGRHSTGKGCTRLHSGIIVELFLVIHLLYSTTIQ